MQPYDYKTQNSGSTVLAVVPIITSAYLVSKAKPKQWGPSHSYLYKRQLISFLKRLMLKTMNMWKYEIWGVPQISFPT